LLERLRADGGSRRLYALLVGRGPIEGPNQLAVLARVLADERARPRAIGPRVPADLEAIALKCLEKERAARHGSVRVLADDLAPRGTRSGSRLGHGPPGQWTLSGTGKARVHLYSGGRAGRRAIPSHGRTDAT
jgi:hypothetical protein